MYASSQTDSQAVRQATKQTLSSHDAVRQRPPQGASARSSAFPLSWLTIRAVGCLKNVQIQYSVGFLLVRISGRQWLSGSLGYVKCACRAASASHLTIGHGTFSCIRPATRSFLQKLLRSSMTANLGSMPRMSTEMCSVPCSNLPTSIFIVRDRSLFSFFFQAAFIDFSDYRGNLRVASDSVLFFFIFDD